MSDTTSTRPTSGNDYLSNRLTNLLKAWEQLSPEMKLAGMTFAEFKTATAPSFDIREENNILRLLLRAGLGSKKNADRVSLAVANQIVSAVKAEGTLGPDSPLYRAMGFIPTSERKNPKQKAANPLELPSETAPDSL